MDPSGQSLGGYSGQRPEWSEGAMRLSGRRKKEKREGRRNSEDTEGGPLPTPLVSTGTGPPAHRGLRAADNY